MDWKREFYMEMERLCAKKEFEKDNDDLEKRLDDLSKNYLYESLRKYQKREKELLYRNVRWGQKLSKLFAETAKTNNHLVLFSMGLFAGIVKTMEFLVKILGETMSDDLISEQALRQKIDKIKVSSAEIMVNGTKEKPYFEIKYFDLSDNEMHIGFSSYKLDVVFGYLEKYFDIAEGNSESEQNNNHILGDLISRKDLLGTERLLMTDIVENNEVAKYILEQVLYDIEHTPTAFDRQKVIKEIEYNREMSKKYSTGLREEGHIEAFDEAISIIKKGGIE